MQKINQINKKHIIGGYDNKIAKSYSWNNALRFGLIGESIVGGISMISQIIHTLNPDPLFYKPDMVDNTAARIFTRIAQHPSKATVSFGSPFF